MKLFVYEHLTCGALAGQVSSLSLLHEGDIMIQAVCEDLASLGYHITILRDRQLPSLPRQLEQTINTIWINNANDFSKAWQKCLIEYDNFLVIAPETDLILLTLHQQIINAGKQFLGCSADVISIATNKLHSWEYLHSNIKMPKTWSSTSWLDQSLPTEKSWVIKPIDGAGCENTFVFDTIKAKQYLQTQTNTDLGKTIVQEYIKGKTLSLSLFVTESEVQLLSINEQVLEKRQCQLSLSHCIVKTLNLVSENDCHKLINKIHDLLPGLWGFVGIDIILNDGHLFLIEINPRLTSSYAENEMRKNTNPALALHLVLNTQNSNTEKQDYGL